MNKTLLTLLTCVTIGLTGCGNSDSNDSSSSQSSIGSDTFSIEKTSDTDFTIKWYKSDTAYSRVSTVDQDGNERKVVGNNTTGEHTLDCAPDEYKSNYINYYCTGNSPSFMGDFSIEATIRVYNDAKISFIIDHTNDGVKSDALYTMGIDSSGNLTVSKLF